MTTLEDEHAIMRLVATYNQAIDHRDAETWADTFTPDGALLVDGVEVARGRADFVGYVARRQRENAPLTRHWVNNALIDVDGDRARMRIYIMTVRIGPNLPAPQPLRMGEYADELVRTDAGWRFARRHMTVVAGKWRAPGQAS